MKNTAFEMQISVTCFIAVMLYTFGAYSVFAAPQQPDINDKFELSEQLPAPSQNEETTNTNESQTNIVIYNSSQVNYKSEANERTQPAEVEPSLSIRIYKYIADPIRKVVNIPKVNQVLRNIGTCLVNGAMELVSYYVPAPVMPLIASAAGLIIPFEPVVMLKQKMPVTSYRRAFQTAMKTFLGTFDRYKPEDKYDPYMTRRFNRRFMKDDKEDEKNLE